MKIESLERVLREHALTQGLPEAQVRFITGCAKNARFAAGEYLFHEGDESNALYLIRSGRISLELDVPPRGVVEIESVGPGDVIGASAMSPPFRWHVDGRATESTLAIQVDGECLRNKCEADPALGYALLQRLLADLAGRLVRARLQQLDLYRSEAG